MKTEMPGIRMFGAVLLAAAPCVAAPTAAPPRAATLEVDARDVGKMILHAKLSLPAAPGALTLAYPKWLPGEHGPTGPIADLAGLRVSAAQKPLAWARDAVDMYAFHVDVPAGADAVEISLDLLSPADTGGFSSGSSITTQLALVSWNQVLLYPKGANTDELLYAPTLLHPSGWKIGTALTAAKETSDRVDFVPVSLTTLVDSPVLIGAHMRTIPLADTPVPHRLCLAADSEAALAAPDALVASYRRLVAEALALFGAHHYRAYTFLVTLSDHAAHFGLEHHESSDDRVAERSMVADDERRVAAGLLPHEMTHSWNGKYRRPAGLEPGRLDEPMKGELLWVYEGLTQYIGEVLTARSGLRTADEERDSLALAAASQDVQTGRVWRPLADTAVAAQLLYGARSDGTSWRRSVDYYDEGTLIWLEADVRIRTLTSGAKSLDDLCRLFFGGESGQPKVVTYDLGDLVAALARVAPYDWKGFFETRLRALTEHAPLEGLAASGWKLAFTDTRSELLKSREEVQKFSDFRYSIGLLLGKDGAVSDVVAGSLADKAGVGAGGTLVAVNGRKASPQVLRDALHATNSPPPLELLVETGEFYRTLKLEYTGGERYPKLLRDESKPDVLSLIMASKTRA